MLVSASEKKPATSSITTSALNSQLSGMVSTTSGRRLTLQDQLEDHLAPDVGQQQCGEPRERPAHRRLPAPAAQVVPRQQGAEDAPGQDAEERLVREGEGLAEELRG